MAKIPGTRQQSRHRQVNVSTRETPDQARVVGLFLGEDIERNLAITDKLGKGTKGGSVGLARGLSGVAASFVSNAYVNTANTNLLLGTQVSFAFFVRIQRTTSQNYRHAIRKEGATTYDLSVGIGSEYSPPGASKICAHFGLKNYNEFEITEQVALVDGQTATYMLVWHSAAQMVYLFKEGRLENSLSYTDGSNAPNANTLYLGNGSAGIASQYFPGNIYVAGVILGYVPLGQAAWLTQNIYRLTKNYRRQLVGFPGGGAVTYTFAAGGSIVFSGAAQEKRTRVAGASGTVVFSGAAALKRTRTQQVSGQIQFSGAITQTHIRQFAPTGTLAFTATNALKRTKIQVPTGQIVFAGSAPLSSGGAKVLSAGGTITFSGAAARVRIKAFAPTGNISFSGAVTTFRVRSLVPTGQLLFSGSSPTTHTKITLPSGQVVFSGNAGIVFIPAGYVASGVTTRITVGVNRTSRLS